MQMLIWACCHLIFAFMHLSPASARTVRHTQMDGEWNPLGRKHHMSSQSTSKIYIYWYMLIFVFFWQLVLFLFHWKRLCFSKENQIVTAEMLQFSFWLSQLIFEIQSKTHLENGAFSRENLLNFISSRGRLKQKKLLRIVEENCLRPREGFQ